MRTIGLAVFFLLASAFGALAADMGAQGAGTAPRAHKSMHHKTMHYGTSHRYRTGYYRHGHYRTGYYGGGAYYAGGVGRSAYIHGHRRVYGVRYYGGHRAAIYHGHRRTAMMHTARGTSMHHTGRRTSMHHRAGTTGTRKASKNPVKGTQNKGKASTY